MWNKIKLILTAVSALAASIGVFVLGGRLNQAKHDRQKNEELEEILEKAKEADNEANKEKDKINSDNVTDVLNQL